MDKTARRGTLRSVHLTKYSSGHQNEKNGMGGACALYGGQESCMQNFGGET